MTTAVADAGTALTGYQAQVGAHAFAYAALRRGPSGAEFAAPIQGRYLAELTGVTA